MIVMFGNNNCVRCGVAKNTLIRSGIEFEYRDSCELEISSMLPYFYNPENGKAIDYWPYDTDKLKKLLGVK